MENIETSSNSELQQLINLCVGRILRLGSRSAQEGDSAEYDKYRSLAMAANEELKSRTQTA